MTKLKHIAIPIAIGILASAAAYVLGLMKPIQNLELMTVDLRFEFRGERSPGDNIVIAAIDDQTQMDMNTVWPFPRDWHAQLITNLHKAGARIVNFDVFFDTTDKKNPGSDIIFAKQIKHVMRDKPGHPGTDVILGGMVRRIDSTAGTGIQVVTPNTTLTNGTPKPYYGVVNQPLDADEKVRRSSLFVNVKEFDTELSSYAFETAAIFLGLDPDAIRSGYYEKARKNIKSARSLHIDGKRNVKVGFEGANIVFPINYYGPPGTFPTVPFEEFLLMDIDTGIVLGADSDGDGKADNAVNFHTLTDARNQLLPPAKAGVFAPADTIALAAGYSEKTDTYFFSEFDPKSGGCIMLMSPAFSDTLEENRLVSDARIELGKSVFPSKLHVSRDGKKLLALNAFNGSLVIVDLKKRKASGTVPLPDKAAASFKSVNEFLKTGDINGAYDELVGSANILHNRQLGEYIANLPGVRDLVFYSDRDFSTRLLSDDTGSALPFLPKQIRLSLDGEKLFILSSDNRLFSLSFQDGVLSQFQPFPAADTSEHPVFISSIEYFGFEHKPSDEQTKDTLIKEKLYALDLNRNRIFVFDANTLKFITRINMPEQFNEDIKALKEDDTEYPADTKMAAMSLAASAELGRIFVTYAGWSPAKYKTTGRMLSSYRKPYSVMSLNTYTDMWFSGGLSLGAPPHENIITSNGGRFMVMTDTIGKGPDGAPAALPGYTVFDGQTPLDRYFEGKAETVKGRIILVGPTTEALHDVFATPFFDNIRTPGVEIHANAIQNIIDGSFLRIFKSNTLGGLLLLLALGIAAALITYHVISKYSIFTALLSVSGIILTWWFFAWILFVDFSPYTLLLFATTAAMIALYAALYPGFTHEPIKPFFAKLLPLQRNAFNPLAALLFVFLVVCMIPGLGIGPALAKKSPFIKAWLGGGFLLVLVFAYIAAAEIVPFFIHTLTSKSVAFGGEAKEAKSIGKIFSYRHSDVWRKFSMSAFMVAVCFIGAGLLMKGETSAANALKDSGIDLYTSLVRDVLVPFVTPLLSIIIGFAVTTLYSAMTEGKEKREIKGMFSKYVSADVVDMMVGNPASIKLGGAKTNITILFSDIRGFTSISEALQPEQVVAFLNEYLTEMTDIVIETKGTLDKFIGDAVMAFWGAPIPQDDHALRAAKTAVRMLRALDELNGRWVREGKNFPRIRIGLGLNSADVIVGNIGSDMRMDYTVIGDGVNLASRLEGQSKTYGVTIVVSESVHTAIKDHVWTRKLDDIAVKGKKEPVTIYQIIDFKDEAFLNS